jgi:hypothetical protein
MPSLSPDAVRASQIKEKYATQPMDFGSMAAGGMRTGAATTSMIGQAETKKKAQYFQQILDAGLPAMQQIWNELDPEIQQKVPQPDETWTQSQESKVSWYKMALKQQDFQASKAAVDQPYGQAAGTLYKEGQLTGQQLLATKAPEDPEKTKKWPQTREEVLEFAEFKAELRRKYPTVTDYMVRLLEERARAGKDIELLPEHIDAANAYVTELENAVIGKEIVKKDILGQPETDEQGNVVTIMVPDNKTKLSLIKSARRDADELKKALRKARTIARDVKPPPKPKEPKAKAPKKVSTQAEYDALKPNKEGFAIYEAPDGSIRKRIFK